MKLRNEEKGVRPPRATALLEIEYQWQFQFRVCRTPKKKKTDAKKQLNNGQQNKQEEIKVTDVRE